MEKDTALEVSQLLIECSENLNKSLLLIKKNSSEEEFRKYQDSVGRILGEMLLELMNPIYFDYPDIRPDGMREIKPKKDNGGSGKLGRNI